jgi:hypothetical protein
MSIRIFTRIDTFEVNLVPFDCVSSQKVNILNVHYTPEALEHVLQNCELYTDARESKWSAQKAKLFGTSLDLDRTINFIKATGLLIQAS